MDSVVSLVARYSEVQAKESSYGYVPNLPANIVGVVLFGIILLLNVVFGVWLRQWWFFVSYTCCAILEIIGYGSRIAAHFKLFDFQIFTMQLCTLIIAPAFMSAGIYYQLAKIVTVLGPEHFSIMSPMYYNAIFTTCDVISLVVQGVGGGIASSKTHDQAVTGAWIMVGGIAFQVASLVVFSALFAYTMYQVWRARGDTRLYDPKWQHIWQKRIFSFWFPAAIAWSLLFLIIRSIYRVIELAAGWDGYIIRTERYFLILDGLMIVLGMAPLTLLHPGFVLGREVIPVKGLHKEAAAVDDYNDSLIGKEFHETEF